MAQIWTESCQWTTDPAKFIRRYFEGQAFYSGTAGRNGGAAYGGRWHCVPLHPQPVGGEFIFFLRVRVTSQNEPVIGIMPTGAGPGSTWTDRADVYVHITPDGRLRVQYGFHLSSPTVVCSSPPGMVTFIGTIYGLAGKITMHPTAGTVDLLLDGAPVPGCTGITGVQTSRFGASTWSNFVTDGNYRCDLFVADGTNPSGNDIDFILPDVRVDYRGPNDNGTLGNTFMGNDGNSLDNFLHVDEITPDDDLTYVQALAPALDSYQLQDAPVGMQIIGVTSMVTARKTDAGVATLRQGVRTAGVNGLSTNYALAVSYVTYCQQHGVNPAGGLPWTEVAFNDTQLLVEKL